MSIKSIILLVASLNLIACEIAHPHLHQEVKIVGYTGPLSKEILSLFRGVEYLGVYDSHITHTPSHLVSLLPNLKVLHVENTTHENVDHPNVLKGSNNLEELHFINNRVEMTKLETLHDLSKLRVVKVIGRDNPHKVINSNSLKGTSLEVFQYSKGGVEIVEAGAFNGLDKLEILDLSDNKIQKFTKDAIPHSKNLKNLNLAGNLLESFSIKDLPELPHLEELNISNNPLKSFDVTDIEKIAPNLKKLHITKNPQIQSQLEKFTNSNYLVITNNSTANDLNAGH